MKTFLVDSLFYDPGEYVAVCSDNTGEIVRHINKNMPQEPQEEITGYQISMEHLYATWERGKSVVQVCHTMKQARDYVKQWQKNGYKFTIEPIYEIIQPEPEFENEKQLNLF